MKRTKTSKRPTVPPILRCACGCGTAVKKGRKYVRSCYDKNRIVSEETKRKISENPYRQTLEYKEKQKKAQLGRKHSEETKKKMSETHKGKIFSEETRKRMSESAKKRGTPIKSLKKMWESTRGSSLPEYRKKQNSLARKRDWENPEYRKRFTGENWSGENSPNWHGGISFLPYSYEFNKELKNKILLRDSYKCQNPNCWGKNTDLHVHHINYNKKDNTEQNLITLCNSCNGRANTDRNNHTLFYKTIIQKISNDQD